jgi:L-methionine (R)-S-oxide reductase
MKISKKNKDFLERIHGCKCGGNIWRNMLSDAIYEIKKAFPRYTWVGIYLTDGEYLVLETFLGKPTAHIRIPFSKGICGAAATQKQTVMVKDVKLDDRYIACDIAVKSELVIPIVRQDLVLGVLDIDSNWRDAFSEEERYLLEEAVKIMVESFPVIHK